PYHRHQAAGLPADARRHKTFAISSHPSCAKSCPDTPWPAILCAPKTAICSRHLIKTLSHLCKGVWNRHTESSTPIKVYQANNSTPLNPLQPEASHVAIRDGKILAVGTEADVQAWGAVTTDDRYADNVLMPGLIEGHCHLHEGVVWRYVY